MFPKLKHPSRLLICGPSMSGKTWFTCQLLFNIDIFDKPITKIMWYNSELNALPPRNKLPFNLEIEFFDKIPEKFENPENKRLMIILDDMMEDASSSRQISELFTKGSHHRNMTIVLITQNLFHQNKYSRDISLNCSYIIIFKVIRDRSQLGVLFRQMYPENARALMKIYKEVTQQPHSYLFIDLTQGTNDLLRFRTNIFNHAYATCYCAQIKENAQVTQTIANEPTYVINVDKSTA